MKLNNTALFFLVFLLTACNSNNQGGGVVRALGAHKNQLILELLIYKRKQE